MDDEKSVEVALWILLLVQTIGSVDLPGRGPRKMPAPRSYLIILVGMGVLLTMADAGYGKAAKAMAWVTVLVATIIGPFGQKLISFFNGVAGLAPKAPSPATYSDLTQHGPF